MTAGLIEDQFSIFEEETTKRDMFKHPLTWRDIYNLKKQLRKAIEKEYSTPANRTRVMDNRLILLDLLGNEQK